MIIAPGNLVMFDPHTCAAAQAFIISVKRENYSLIIHECLTTFDHFKVKVIHNCNNTSNVEIRDIYVPINPGVRDAILLSTVAT